MSNTVGVVVIDDEISYLDAFELTLTLSSQFHTAGRASDYESGIATVRETTPDLVVADYRFPGGVTGTQLAAELRTKQLTMPVVILTDFLAPQVRREVATLDDVHAISKRHPMKQILTAMSSIAAGNATIDLTDTAATQPNSATGDADMSAALTENELAVLEQLARGKTPAEIAIQMNLSLHTIRARIKAIHKKLEVSSQGEALAIAMRLGLVVPAH